MTTTGTPTVTLRLTKTTTVQHRGRRSWGPDATKTLNLPTYDVLVNGERVGEVARAMVTREAPRARGSRISNGRWQSPAWIAGIPRVRHGLDYDTRASAIEHVLELHGIEWLKARDLAAAAKVEK